MKEPCGYCENTQSKRGKNKMEIICLLSAKMVAGSAIADLYDAYEKEDFLEIIAIQHGFCLAMFKIINEYPENQLERDVYKLCELWLDVRNLAFELEKRLEMRGVVNERNR